MLLTTIFQYWNAEKGEIDEILFNTLIQVLFKYRLVSDAYRILEIMKIKEFPSAITYEILINAYGKLVFFEKLL